MTAAVTKTRDQSVKATFLGGGTMQEVAKKHGLTRNQVAGIIDRLRRKGQLPPATTRQKSGGTAGLAARIKAEKRRQERQAAKAMKPKKPARLAASNVAPVRPAGDAEDFQPSVKSKPLALSGAFAFEPLEGVAPVPFGSPGCKFPVDGMTGKGMLWCGASRQPGEVYCEVHCRIAYTPPKIRKAA